MRVQCSWQIPPNKAAEDVQRCRAKAQYDLTIQRGFEKTCAHLRCANSMNTDHPLQSLSSFEVLESLNQIAHCSRNLQEPPGISRNLQESPGTSRVQNFLFKRLFPSAKDPRTSPRSSNCFPDSCGVPISPVDKLPKFACAA